MTGLDAAPGGAVRPALPPLGRPARFWTREKLDALRVLAKTCTAEECAERLGAASGDAVYRAATRIHVRLRGGKTGTDKWADPAYRAARAARCGGTDWDETRVAELACLARDHSAGETARLMGFSSRAAVVGKAWRLGIRFRGGNRGPAAEAAPDGAGFALAFASANGKGDGRKLVALPADPVATWPAFARLPDAPARALDELDADDCRWPVAPGPEGDEARYCGRKRAAFDPGLKARLRGAPCYCLVHVLVATRAA